MEKKRLLVIIPAYNEEKVLGSVIESVRAELPEVQIAVINDGSYDMTEKVSEQKGVKVISLLYNMGIGVAEQTGYSYANKEGFDIVVRVDADGQHDARFIADCIKPLLDDSADMVIGSRYLRQNYGFQSTLLRRMGIKWLSIIIKLLTGTRISDPTSGFRAINKKLIRVFSYFYPTDYPEPESLLMALKSGFRVKETPVTMKERIEGVSSINARSAIYYIIKVTLALLVDESRIMRRKSLWIHD